MVLIGILVACLIVVCVTYILLYITVRRATLFRETSMHSSRGDCESTNAAAATPRLREFPPPNVVANPSHHRTSILKQQESCQSNNCSPKPNKMRKSVDIQSTPPAYFQNSEVMADLTVNEACSSLIDRTSNVLQTPSIVRRRRIRRDSRLLKRHKCIIVILTVCCMYLIYLSFYFTVQVFHYYNVNRLKQREFLQRQYTIQLILRYMFVLQASLNPLIFFRIKTFRVSLIMFYKTIFRCGGAQRNAGRRKISRPSMIENGEGRSII